MVKKTIRFFKEVKGELKKVTWSTKEELIRTTVLVLIGLVVFTVFISFADMGFARFLQWLIRL